MRVLSFIPAVLLAAASFVVAAPTSSPVDSSCVPSSSAGSGNDASLQSIISILANATTIIGPISVQLASLQGSACTPDAVSGVLVQITAVVTHTVNELQASVEVDLSGVDYSTLCAAIYGLMNAIFGVLEALVTATVFIGVGATASIQVVISAYLDAVIALAQCINLYVTASGNATLDSVVALLVASVNLVVTIS